MKKNRKGFALIELFPAILIISLILAIALPWVSRIKRAHKMFPQYFGMKYPASPVEMNADRSNVVTRLVMMRDKLALAEGEQASITEEMKDLPKSTAADILRSADLQTALQVALDKQSAVVSKLSDDYSDALRIAYNAGYVRETLMLGSSPPSFGC